MPSDKAPAVGSTTGKPQQPCFSKPTLWTRSTTRSPWVSSSAQQSGIYAQAMYRRSKRPSRFTASQRTEHWPKPSRWAPDRHLAKIRVPCPGPLLSRRFERTSAAPHTAPESIAPPRTTGHNDHSVLSVESISRRESRRTHVESILTEPVRTSGGYTRLCSNAKYLAMAERFPPVPRAPEATRPESVLVGRSESGPPQ